MIRNKTCTFYCQKSYSRLVYICMCPLHVPFVCVNRQFILILILAHIKNQMLCACCCLCRSTTNTFEDARAFAISSSFTQTHFQCTTSCCLLSQRRCKCISLRSVRITPGNNNNINRNTSHTQTKSINETKEMTENQRNKKNAA